MVGKALDEAGACRKKSCGYSNLSEEADSVKSPPLVNQAEVAGYHEV